eukprot:CAMPEP_0197627702 /NCGR_PEP_ID=MMETSP1338-20131121/6239_1 /TAXON_ID=43686 ORGANISM="Pelagodinium beii, Strain RCC1491" /NCGR_SAMPLE_ID=MMETSP1338 /ASSEMBLY_ACC=CAM_ASM_000754 /LENGTH=470 /DNA_ID=CAMNT_0043198495 /DNA_START=102 /DNA_END=1514 /DNA_ORIENTATION=+
MAGLSSRWNSLVAPESSAHLKDGLMAYTKQQEWKPTPLAIAGRDWRSSQAQASNRGSSRPIHLYRAPLLPATLGTEPAGNVVSVQRWREDTRDWRKLPSKAIASHLEELQASAAAPNTPRLYATHLRQPLEDAERRVRQMEGLVAAVAVGTLQACQAGYQAPGFGEGAKEVPIVRQPTSVTFTAPIEVQEVGVGAVDLQVSEDMDPIAACQQVLQEPRPPRVGLVHFVALDDPRVTNPPLSDLRLSQLHTRTSYLLALQEMQRQLHMEPNTALSGCVIHTADVSILRGPVEEGAQWLEAPACVDVLTAGIQRRPRCDEQGQYARITEKAAVAKTVDDIFACALANDIEVLVFPPLGVNGAAGCYHPAADAGDLLRKAILEHSGHVSRVWICSEFPGQLRGLWTTFAEAVQKGRQPIERKELVPLSVSPYYPPGWGVRSAAVYKKKGAALSARSLRPERDLLSSAGQAIAS